VLSRGTQSDGPLRAALRRAMAQRARRCRAAPLRWRRRRSGRWRTRLRGAPTSKRRSAFTSSCAMTHGANGRSSERGRLVFQCRLRARGGGGGWSAACCSVGAWLAFQPMACLQGALWASPGCAAGLLLCGRSGGQEMPHGLVQRQPRPHGCGRWQCLMAPCPAQDPVKNDSQNRT
jgi:hypothetical protein